MSQRKKKLERKIASEQVNKMNVSSAVKLVRISQILKENWKLIVFVLIAVVAVYMNSLKGNFVSDDYATIPQNPLAASFQYFKNLPDLVTLSNVLLSKTFGVGSSIPFHTYSLFLYLIVCVEIFVVTQLLFGNKTISAITSLIFAVMPIHVEAVSWISGKPYLLVSVFILAALASLIEYFNSGFSKKYAIWLGIFVGLAFFSDKSRSLAFFIMAAFYVLAYKLNYLKSEKARKMMVWGAIVIAVLGVFLVKPILARVASVNSGYNTSESIFYNPFFQYPTAMTKYLQLMFVPFDLTLYHTMYILPTWLNWLVILTYAALLVVYYFKDKRIFLALVFIFAATAPSMAPVKVSWLVAERYGFLGSWGFALLLGILAEKNISRLPWLTVPLLSFYLIFGGYFVYMRNTDWSTNHNLWVRTCQVSPNSHNAWNNIGDDYDKLKQYDNAIKGFGRSYEIKPNYADAYHNQANILFKTGRMDLARKGYEKAVSISPQLYQSYMSLMQIDINEKKFDLAYQHISQALKVQPNDIGVNYAYAVALINIGKIDEGAQRLRMIIQAVPNYKPAKDALDQITLVKGS